MFKKIETYNSTSHFFQGLKNFGQYETISLLLMQSTNVMSETRQMLNSLLFAHLFYTVTRELINFCFKFEENLFIAVNKLLQHGLMIKLSLKQHLIKLH